VLVLGAMGYMTWHELRHEGTPPILTVATDSVVAQPNGYLLEFHVSNTGETTAADVTVEGALESEGATIEVSDVVLAYVPPRGVAGGGLFFTHDPRRYAVKLRAKGYARP
jgi:uncharacterized protein (TIGR02588 family)